MMLSVSVASSSAIASLKNHESGEAIVGGIESKSRSFQHRSLTFSACCFVPGT